MQKQPIRLNLGCGDDYKEGYINCDWLGGMKADKYFDLQQFPYPFEESSCDEVLMDNVLNLLDDVVNVIKEVHRILKPGGVFRLYVPYAKSDWAFQSLYAQHFFTERSMQKFSDKWDPHYYPHTRFELIQNKLFCNTETTLGKVRNLVPFKPLLRYYFFNIYDCIYFEMKAIK